MAVWFVECRWAIQGAHAARGPPCPGIRACSCSSARATARQKAAAAQRRTRRRSASRARACGVRHAAVAAAAALWRPTRQRLAPTAAGLLPRRRARSQSAAAPADSALLRVPPFRFRTRGWRSVCQLEATKSPCAHSAFQKLYTARGPAAAWCALNLKLVPQRYTAARGGAMTMQQLLRPTSHGPTSHGHAAATRVLLHEILTRRHGPALRLQRRAFIACTDFFVGARRAESALASLGFEFLARRKWCTREVAAAARPRRPRRSPPAGCRSTSCMRCACCH